MRNVMIYFDVETKKPILGSGARVLRPDGYLLLGAAETTINLGNEFERTSTISRDAIASPPEAGKRRMV